MRIKKTIAGNVGIVGLPLSRLAVIGLLFVSGCFSPDPSNLIPESDEPVVTVASTTQIEIIQASLAEGVTVADAYAVRSQADDWAHFVAARLDGVEQESAAAEDIGLWFMQDGMDVPGDHYAVNSVAMRFSSLVVYAGESIQDGQRRDVASLLELTDSRRSKVYP